MSGRCFDNRVDSSYETLVKATCLMKESFKEFTKQFCVQAEHDEHGYYGDSAKLLKAISYIQSKFILDENQALINQVLEHEKYIKYCSSSTRDSLATIRNKFYNSIGKPEYIAIGNALEVVQNFESKLFE